MMFCTDCGTQLLPNGGSIYCHACGQAQYMASNVVNSFVDIPEDKIGLVIGKGGQTINKIRSETGADVRIQRDGRASIRGTEESVREAKKRIRKLFEVTGIDGEGITKVFVPEYLVRFVYGKKGNNIRKIKEETNTVIQKKDGYFNVKGDDEKQKKKASLRIKELACDGKRVLNLPRLKRFPFIDSSIIGQENTFQLELVEKSHRRFIGKPHYRLILKGDPLNKETESINLDSLREGVLQVLREIHEEKKEKRLNVEMWCHFGHVYIGNVEEENKDKLFDLQDIERHLDKAEYGSSIDGWRTVFDEGIATTEFEILEKYLSVNPYRVPPCIRHELEFLTPSLQKIRLKTFLEIEGASEGKELSFRFSDGHPVSTKRVLARVSSQDKLSYELSVSSHSRAIIDIMVPSYPLDCHFSIKTNSPEEAMTPEEEEDNKVLIKYLNENLKLEDGELKLQENKPLPEGFEFMYRRRCERRKYPYLFNDEDFTVTMSEEELEYVEELRSVDEVLRKNDVHLHCDELDQVLEKNDWQPDHIVDKLPKFLGFVRDLQRLSKVEETIPPEILARGPEASEAYRLALESGKTKNRRVLIMLIGQARAGKTSVLRSLKGENFNSEEDSTVGITLAKSSFKLKEEPWGLEDGSSSNDISFEHITAKAIAEKLRADDIRKNTQHNTLVEIPQSSSLDVKYELEDERESEVYNMTSSMSAIEINKDLKPRENYKTPETVAPKVLTRDEEFATKARKGLSNNPFKVPENIAKLTADRFQQDETDVKEKNIYFTVLDFAGQSVYYSTHPIFMSPKAIYILVHSLKQDLRAKAVPTVKHGAAERITDEHCPMTNMDGLEYWLSCVASLSIDKASIATPSDDYETGADSKSPQPSSSDAPTATEVQKGFPRKEIAESYSADHDSTTTASTVSLPEKLPPVFVTCTHADVPFEGQDPKTEARKILKTLGVKRQFGGHVVRNIFPVDNTCSGKGKEKEDINIACLRKRILETAEKLPHTDEDIPIRWLLFEKKLYLFVEKGYKYISLSETKEVAKECQVQTESQEFRTLLNYLHDLKVLIHFEDTKELDEIVIIDPQWLLVMFVDVITVQPIETWVKEMDPFLTDLEDNGVLDIVLVRHVWKELIDDRQTVDSLLSIMQKFSLLCKWRNPDGSEVFLVPSMLQHRAFEEVEELFRDPDVPPIIVRFKSGYLPLGFFPRLLVAFVQWCTENWKSRQPPTLFSNFVRFYCLGKDMSYSLIITSDMSTITMGVLDNGGPNLNSLHRFCHTVLVFLKTSLEQMQKDFPWMRTMEVEFCFRCPICLKVTKRCDSHKVSSCRRDTCVHYISEVELQHHRPQCVRNPTVHDTTIKKSSFSMWYEDHKERVSAENNVVTVQLNSQNESVNDYKECPIVIDEGNDQEEGPIVVDEDNDHEEFSIVVDEDLILDAADPGQAIVEVFGGDDDDRFWRNADVDEAAEKVSVYLGIDRTAMENPSVKIDR